MFVQYRHVEFNEEFYNLADGVHVKYIKRNHGRALLVAKGKPQYRVFKKRDIVVTATKKTAENAWMEVIKVPYKDEESVFVKENQ